MDFFFRIPVPYGVPTALEGAVRALWMDGFRTGLISGMLAGVVITILIWLLIIIAFRRE
jgi:hypothetical protein